MLQSSVWQGADHLLNQVAYFNNPFVMIVQNVLILALMVRVNVYIQLKEVNYVEHSTVHLVAFKVLMKSKPLLIMICIVSLFPHLPHVRNINWIKQAGLHVNEGVFVYCRCMRPWHMYAPLHEQIPKKPPAWYRKCSSNKTLNGYSCHSNTKASCRPICYSS